MRGASPEVVPCEETENIRDTLFQTFGTNLGLSQQAPRPIPSNVSSTARRYLEILELAPGLKSLLGGGKLVGHLEADGDSPSLVRTASDYSYSADRYAGDGWRVIGDAGGG